MTVALVNDASSPLAALCDTVLPLHAGPELSVAATKSFIAALAAILQLAAHWRRDGALHESLTQLPGQLESALRRDWSAGVPILAGAKDLYVVGRGPGFAIAQEAALKLKEASGLHAEALSAAELMHGPLALAGAEFPVLVFCPADEARAGILEFVHGLHERRVPVIVAGPRAVHGILTLPAGDGLDPHAAPLALIQSFYPLVDAIARARGRDPDNPPHLKKVTETV